MQCSVDLFIYLFSIYVCVLIYGKLRDFYYTYKINKSWIVYKENTFMNSDLKVFFKHTFIRILKLKEPYLKYWTLKYNYKFFLHFLELEESRKTFLPPPLSK